MTGRWSLGRLQLAAFTTLGVLITISSVLRLTNSTAWRIIAITITLLAWIAVLAAIFRRPT